MTSHTEHLGGRPWDPETASEPRHCPIAKDTEEVVRSVNLNFRTRHSCRAVYEDDGTLVEPHAVRCSNDCDPKAQRERRARRTHRYAGLEGRQPKLHPSVPPAGDLGIAWLSRSSVAPADVGQPAWVGKAAPRSIECTLPTTDRCMRRHADLASARRYAAVTTSTSVGRPRHVLQHRRATFPPALIYR